MKAFFVITLAVIFQLSVAWAQDPDAITGQWQSGHGSGRMQIYKKGDKYFGKLTWLKEPNDEHGKPKRDIHNPDEQLTNRPILGLEILKDLEYKSDGFWSGGSVYNPKTGRNYNCQVKIRDLNKMDFRAFWGINLIGKTETWTRVK